MQYAYGIKFSGTATSSVLSLPDPPGLNNAVGPSRILIHSIAGTILTNASGTATVTMSYVDSDNVITPSVVLFRDTNPSASVAQQVPFILNNLNIVLPAQCSGVTFTLATNGASIPFTPGNSNIINVTYDHIDVLRIP